MLALERYLPSGLALFVRGWVDDPLAVGAVAPSGRKLAEMMASAIAPHDRVVELGPGTGTLTRAIIDRGIDRENMALIELSPKFAARLEEQFTGVHVVCGDAGARHPELDSFEGRTDVVICGLPLLLFSRYDRTVLLERSFELLRPGGALFQFTYGGKCPLRPRELRPLGLRAERVGQTLFNFPPAFVFRVAREGRALAG